MTLRVETFADEICARLTLPSRILEIGCGNGELSSRLREAGHYVVAIDRSPREGVDALAIAFEDFDAPPYYFDAVVMQLVLHHADDLDAMLEKAMHTLRLDGIIAIDDYGWERAGREVPTVWKEERANLHTSKTMLERLRLRFSQRFYEHHAYLEDGSGRDRLAFTFIGSPNKQWPIIFGARETRRIILAEHNPDWRSRFEMERRRIVNAIGKRALRVEHIGSTAVPNLAAKPVIDILLAVDDPLDEDLRRALEGAGYSVRLEEPDHRMFRSPQSDVHVHLWREDSPEIERHLTFRNRLLDDSADRALYERVKRELAKRNWKDPNDYAQAKTTVVAQILARGQKIPERR